MFNYDLKRLARDAMAYTAQRHVVKKLPSELQLQVMGASVLYHASVLSIGQASAVAKEAACLFDGQYIKHLATDIHHTLQRIAEQAILNNVIFKAHLSISHPDVDLTHRLDRSLRRHIHYIEVTIVIHTSLNSDYEEVLDQIASTWFTLKTRLSNLKTCVLTLMIGSCKAQWLHQPMLDNRYVLSATDAAFPERFLKMRYTRSELLETILANLLGNFAEKAPARRCFARIMHQQRDMDDDTLQRYYGPLVPANRDEQQNDSRSVSTGARILTQAYRLAHAVDFRDHRGDMNALRSLLASTSLA